MEIQLSQSCSTIVDEADAELLASYRWHASNSEGRFYARTSVGGRKNVRKFYMHRLIMGAAKNEEVDHINGDTLDNRRCNLRLCRRIQNARNVKKKSGSSQYKGVTWLRWCERWMARITVNYRQIILGYFTDETKAAKAYDEAARKHFGEFAKTNF